MTRKTLITIAAAIFAMAVLALFLPALEIRREMEWVCPVCGSRKHQTHWIFGATSSPLVETSRLHQWILRRHGSHEHDWRYVQGTGKNIFGSSTSFADGLAPEILFLPREMLDSFVLTAPDEEIARFVDVMSHGTESEQRQLVERLCHRPAGE